MKYTDILWDYNGTLLDDVESALAAANKLLRERNMKTLDSIDAYHSVFTFPVIDYYKRLGFDFTKESFDTLSRDWIAEYSEQLKNCTLRDGAVEILSKLSRKGLRQSVISAAESSMLKEQLSFYNIISYFDEVLGIEGIKAESKLCLASSWRARHPEAKALFIGDTLHDLDAAKEAGADCILICGGHHSKQTLMRYSVPVIENVREIFDYL